MTKELSDLETFVIGCERLKDVFAKARVKDIPFQTIPATASESGQYLHVLSEHEDYAVMQVTWDFFYGGGFDEAALVPYGSTIGYVLCPQNSTTNP
jgi:hypothetical protein